MSSSGPREYLPADERRQRLLDAALSVVGEGGIAALSLRTVADRAGVAHRVVSYAFGSKSRLVEALLERETERAIDAGWNAPLSGATLSEALRAAVTAYMDTVRADPGRAEIVVALTSSARLIPDLAEAVTRDAELSSIRIRDHLTAWTEANPDVVIDSERTAHGLLAAAEGVCAWWLTTRDDERLNDVIDAVTAGIVRTPPVLGGS